MCFLKPLEVQKIIGNKVVMTNDVEAFYDRKIGKIKKGDKVLVYGNLIIRHINKNE